jgi:S-formylglutathione hydrolase
LRVVVHISDYKLEEPQLKFSQTLNDKVAGGEFKRIKHWSECNQCEMSFAIFIPPSPSRTSAPPPVLYFLAGLTCDDLRAGEKGGFFETAAKNHVAIIFPDTSARTPEGQKIKGEDDGWDFGSAAGFYLNATTDDYKKHYNMETYITKELPGIVDELFRVDTSKAAIFGHSMGGHGAMSLHFRNPGMY